MNFNDTGNLMASTNHHHTIEIWDMKSSKLKTLISSHSEIVTGVEFFHKNEDNEFFLSCSLDKTIKLWRNYINVHTFLEHSDWVRCISVREDNLQFLSGCVSSIVKLWDLPTQRVIGSITNQSPDAATLTTVNSLNFLNTNPNLFIIGLRNGEVKVCDSRIHNKNSDFIQNVGLVQTFKAHQTKLNTAKISMNDKYLLTSGRDSLLRLWDFRKLPKGNITNEKNYCINEFNKHKCVGYNIECNFYINEKYAMTGSEDGNVYIYDINDKNKYCKLKTKLKCINLIKQLPHSYNFAFTGLEDISIYIWSAHKNILKYYEKYCYKSNDQKEAYDLDDSDNEKDDPKEDNNFEIYNSLIEEIMTECGDTILKIFHSNNLTYNGINLERLNEIINNSRDEKTKEMLRTISEKFMKKLMENFISSERKIFKKAEKKEKKKEKQKLIKKREIKCSECNPNNTSENNIFNSVDREQLNQLLILPNNYSFNELEEK